MSSVKGMVQPARPGAANHGPKPSSIAVVAASGGKTYLRRREMELVELVARGMGNKEAASAMDVSVKTVEKHRSSAMGKLKVNCVAKLVHLALARGWVGNIYT